MKNNGIILIQGLGADYGGRQKELPKIFSQHGFAILTYAWPKAVIERKYEPEISRQLVDENIILIKEGHPLYSKYIGQEIIPDSLFFAREDVVYEILFEDTSNLNTTDLARLKEIVNVKIYSNFS